MTTTPTTEAPVETDAEWAAKINRLRTRKPAEDFVTIYDPDAREAADQARLALVEVRRRVIVDANAQDLGPDERQALLDADERYLAAKQAVEDAEAHCADVDVVFHFRALPPDVYDQMVFAHPATPEQEALSMGYNPDTYIPAMIAACSVKPLTPEQVVSLMTPWTDPDTGETQPPALNQGDVGALFSTCRNVNEKARVSLGKGSRLTRS